MILKSCKKFLGLLILFLISLPIYQIKSEEKIDIWKNKKKMRTQLIKI